MQESKLVSVIMSVYNETEEVLKQSIKSILNQTWKNIEFIIVNDNPDNYVLQEVLDEYCKKDQRIKILQNQRNLGLAKSMNLAIEQASGVYIARMDADDISALERIEHEILYLEKYRLDMVGTNRIYISESGKEMGKPGKLPTERRAEKLLPYGDPIIHPSVLIKRRVLEEVGGYRNFASAQDYDLWLRMLTKGYKIGILDKPLLFYRIRSDSISQTNYYKQFLFASYARLLYRERKKKNGTDSFSEKNIKKFIQQRYTEQRKKHFDRAYQCFNEGIKAWKNGRKGSGIVLALKAVASDCACAKCIFQLLKYEIKKMLLL